MSHINVQKASLRDYVVCAVQKDDASWTKTVVEIAEFKDEKDAIALCEALNVLIKLSKPQRLLGDFGEKQ